MGLGSGSGILSPSKILLNNLVKNSTAISPKHLHASGEIDLEILKVLHEKHPDAKIEVEVVEPSYAMLNKYK
ncbi:hypothetical protein C0J45_23870, partial [Silurus meridionalis]